MDEYLAPLNWPDIFLLTLLEALFNLKCYERVNFTLLLETTVFIVGQKEYFV